jgi:hypothetical protein
MIIKLDFLSSIIFKDMTIHEFSRTKHINIITIEKDVQ